MAQRRRKRIFTRFADFLAGIAEKFGKMRTPAKLVLIILPLALIAVAIFIITLPGETPILQASITDAPQPAPAYTLKTEPISIPTTTPVVTPDPILKKGDENDQVQELQERLMKLGYLDIDESTKRFGTATETAVKFFQREENLLDNIGLQETGVADGLTQDCLFSAEARPYTLLENTEGPDVKRLQGQLRYLGFLKGSATGKYGTDTTAAVKKFQQHNNLYVDGKAGPDTLDLIFSPNAKPDPSADKVIKAKVNVGKMIAAANNKIGKPYVSGAEGPGSFDCSGLVYYCLHAAGSTRGRYNAAGYAAVNDWKKIGSINQLKKGDLMFFWDSSKGKIGHVSIYIGGGMMIDASFSNGRVMKRPATSSWCRNEFKWGRRPWE